MPTTGNIDTPIETPSPFRPKYHARSHTADDGTPTGHIETIHDLQAYVADPPSGGTGKGIIVIIPDAFGWEFNNLRILADNYAKNAECKVIMPDFMDGWSCSPDVLPYLQTIEDGSKWFFQKMYVLPPLLPLLQPSYT